MEGKEIMKRKILINLLIIITLIIFSGTLMFAQNWLVKIQISDNESKEIYPDEIKEFIYNMYLMRILLPGEAYNLLEKTPVKEDSLDIESKISESLQEIGNLVNYTNEYTNIMLFNIKAHEEGYVNTSRLEEYMENIKKYIKFEIIKRVYLIKEQLPNANVSNNEIDSAFTRLQNEFKSIGSEPNKEELAKLAKIYAKEMKATNNLEKKMDNLMNKSRSKISKSNPFDITINGVKLFEESEVESAYSGYLALKYFYHMGGVLEGEFKDVSSKKQIYDEYKKELNDKDSREAFAVLYLRYYLFKQEVENEGKYDRRLIDRYIKKCLEFFRLNYINIIYSRFTILEDAKEKLTDENIDKAYKRLEDNGIFDELNITSESSKKEYTIEQLYQYLIFSYRQKHIRDLRIEYSIHKNEKIEEYEEGTNKENK